MAFQTHASLILDLPKHRIKGPDPKLEVYVSVYQHTSFVYLYMYFMKEQCI